MTRFKVLPVALMLVAAAGICQVTLAGKAKRLVRPEASFYDLEIAAAKMPVQIVDLLKVVDID